MQSKKEFQAAQKLINQQKLNNCEICYEEKELVKFNDKCQHPNQNCFQCIRKTVKEVINKGDVKVSCLVKECNSVSEFDQYQKFLEKKDIARAENLLLKYYLEEQPDFCYCSNPKGCGGGQLVANYQDLQGYYVCQFCKMELCFRHKSPYHFKFTCKEFDLELENNAELRNNFSLLQNTKNCPTCKNPIEKSSGCSIMICCLYGTHECQDNVKKYKKCNHGGVQFCGTMFCWNCLSKFKDGKRNCNSQCKFAEL